jgi:phage terminase small subunit
MATKKPAKKTKNSSSKESAAQRRKLFATAYLSNGSNATQAAIAAGFSEKTAYSAGCRLLKHVDVQAIIQAAAKKVEEQCGLTLERTLKEIARLAYADPRKLFKEDGSLKQIHELDDDTAATIASVEVDEIGTDGVVIGMTRKVKQWDKKGALDMAMKFHGAYEKDNKQKQPVILQVSSTDEDL